MQHRAQDKKQSGQEPDWSRYTIILATHAILGNGRSHTWVMEMRLRMFGLPEGTVTATPDTPLPQGMYGLRVQQAHAARPRPLELYCTAVLSAEVARMLFVSVAAPSTTKLMKTPVIEVNRDINIFYLYSVRFYEALISPTSAWRFWLLRTVRSLCAGHCECVVLALHIRTASCNFLLNCFPLGSAVIHSVHTVPIDRATASILPLLTVILLPQVIF